MQSRMDKYYTDSNVSSMRRSERNARLYREIYRSGDDNLENLPLSDNTSDIDIKELREMVTSSEKSRPVKKERVREEYHPLRERSVSVDDKIHDINKLLENAKNENNKLKDSSTVGISRNKNNFLTTLESQELTFKEIEGAKAMYNQLEEVKYDKDWEKDAVSGMNLLSNTTKLSLDILSDLSDDGTKEISAPVELDEDVNVLKEEVTAKIKTVNSNVSTGGDLKNDAFYTNVYEFSKKDFECDNISDDDEVFFEEKNGGGLFFKVLFLIIGILVCAAIIFYFIVHYGLNV